MYFDKHYHAASDLFVRQIVLMLELLMVPAIIRTECGFVVSGREALCVLLYRLAFPCRLKDMRLVFGLSESCICETFNWMLHFMDFKWGFLLSLDVQRLVPKLRTFAEAVYNKGCPLTHCWAFIDGTVRGIARYDPEAVPPLMSGSCKKALG